MLEEYLGELESIYTEYVVEVEGIQFSVKLFEIGHDPCLVVFSRQDGKIIKRRVNQNQISQREVRVFENGIVYEAISESQTSSANAIP